MPIDPPLPQPAPPADPQHPPPAPIAPTLHRRFTHGDTTVSIVEHREVTCCGHVTADARYYGVLGDWTPGYAYTTTDYVPGGRPVRVINWRTTTDGAWDLLSRSSVRAAVRDARRRLHEEDLHATYGDLARENRHRYPSDAAIGPRLTEVSPGEVVAAAWGHGFWRAVVADVSGGGVRVLLCRSRTDPNNVRLLTVGKDVRALHAPPERADPA